MQIFPKQPSCTLRLARPATPTQHRESVLLALLLLLPMSFPLAANSQPMGKVRGKVIAKDTGESMSFVNLLLLPADTALVRVGGLTNSDGTFELLARPGTYVFRAQALSYARKDLAGILVDASRPLDLTVAMTPEAIQQEEIVVEARRQHDTENALLAIRQKSASVSDAVSAEQVRRSPDKDAGDVLKRVTGLSVNEGKYVFVRGLGERYSSTEIDGVRLSSPELNKRVVPLDIIPANLLENITVQKTYTADRPAEFGGGDVQVKTRDFPGRRQWAFSVGQGVEEGSTFEQGLRYGRGSRNLWALGASTRAMPEALLRLASNQRVAPRNDVLGIGLTRAQRAEIGRSFAADWSPTRAELSPNGSYALTFGDEHKLGGKSVGLVASGNYSRSQEIVTESARYFFGQDLSDNVPDIPRFDGTVERGTDRIQVGGLTGLSVRLSPAHSLHARAFVNREAESEARYYGSFSDDIGDSIRSNRLRYVERSITTMSLEGRHEFRSAANSRLEWKLSRSLADRIVPDMRKATYQRAEQRYDDDDDNPYYRAEWRLRSQTRGATREFSAMHERGRGGELSWTTPFRLFELGNGKVTAGLSDQWKNRYQWTRKFFMSAPNGRDTLPPDSIFAPQYWTGANGSPDIAEWIFPDDIYDAEQGQTAAFLSVDLPLGRRMRATLGARVEQGVQRLRSYDLFNSQATSAYGALDDTDVLPSANFTWGVTDRVNLRAGASRTLSRPDINELALQRIEDYIPGMRDLPGFTFIGNPNLERALLDNYDLRAEWFPGLGELLAASLFLKDMHSPIELAAQGGNNPTFYPINSESGQNRGLELELRASLGRVWPALQRLSVNANASWIESEVTIPPSLSPSVRRTHPLQGQADRLYNIGVTYASIDQRYDVTMLLSHTGRKLAALGFDVAPDFFDDQVTTLDAAVNLKPMPYLRVKLSGKNLTDAEYTGVQGPVRYYSTKPGPGYSLSVSFGS